MNYALAEAQFGTGRGIKRNQSCPCPWVLGGFSMAAEIVIIIIPRKAAYSKFCEGSRSRQEEEAEEAIQI